MPSRTFSVIVALAALGLATAPAAHAASSPAKVSAKPIAKALSTKNATTTVTVKNTSKRRLSGLSLSVGTTKGVRVTLTGARRGQRSRKLTTLKAGKSVRVGVRLRRTAKGPKSGKVTLRVRRAGKTIATGPLAFGPKAPTPAPNSLAGRYFWGSNYTISGIDQYTLYFTGPNLVYTGDLQGTFPTCTTVTDTCKPYAYVAKANALTIDGKPATLEGNKLTLDNQAHWELGTATAGARWDTVLTYSNSSGICPLYCNYHTEYLTFRPDGTFIRSSVSSGSGPVIDWSVVPPDSKGTYDVRPDRLLLLAFADGTQRLETLGIFPADDGSYPVNPSAGIVLDSDGYFDIRD